MKRLSVGAFLLAATFLGGCNSAKITDVYLAPDADGVRRTSCINTQAEQYYLFIEVLSFRDDTLVWPVLSVVKEVDPVQPFVFKSEELREFGNFAPGKGETTLALEIEREKTGEKTPEGDEVTRDYARGLFRMDVFLNDEGAASETLFWTIDDNQDDCPLSPIPNTY
ncbi:MAG TPA: hypothetical protein PKD61_31875 [Polyangiaceae bacterium]|nr:hypothetical protein [Polyangiaceae bacterium]